MPEIKTTTIQVKGLRLESYHKLTKDKTRLAKELGKKEVTYADWIEYKLGITF